MFFAQEFILRSPMINLVKPWFQDIDFQHITLLQSTATYAWGL